MRAILFFPLYTTFFLAMSTLSSAQVNTIRICGRNLAEALAIVCYARGYNMAFRSGSTPSASQGSAANIGISPDRRRRRGIVDECCHNWCPLATLESYCREDESPTSTSPKPGLHISKRSNSPKNFVTESEIHEIQGVTKELTYNHNDEQGLLTYKSLNRIMKLLSGEDQNEQETLLNPIPMNHPNKSRATRSIKVKTNNMKRISSEYINRFYGGVKSQKDLITLNYKTALNYIMGRRGTKHKQKRNNFDNNKELSRF